VNAWSMLSVDQERGILYVPLTSPAYDYYGGDRPGKNLFGDCLLALDAATGKRLWHFQTIHHNLWDWDLPAQPNLVTVERGGKEIPAVAQVTKTGFVFVFDRVTGKPLFDIEERAVPQSEVPGERTWPTQPIPVKPPPYARQTFSFDELTDVTPESRAECGKLLAGAVTGPMFRPVGVRPTVMFPGPTRRQLGRRLVRSHDRDALCQLDGRGGAVPGRQAAGGRGCPLPQSGRRVAILGFETEPLPEAAVGHLTAIDLNKVSFAGGWCWAWWTSCWPKDCRRRDL